MTKRTLTRRMKPPKGDATYHEIWRLAEDAVADCMRAHPDYFTRKGIRAGKISLVKRVTGTMRSFVAASAKDVGSGT